MLKPIFQIFAFALIAFTVGQVNASVVELLEDPVFEKKVLPLLNKYCVECHAPGDMEGLDFLAIENAAGVSMHRGLYSGVFEAMQNQSMPPGGFDQPSEEERKLVLDWIKQTLKLKPEETDRIAPYVVESFQDREGNLWFGTMQKGVARFDGKSLQYFTKDDGLPNNTVSSITQGRDGVIWFGTHGGVAKFDGTSFTSIGLAEGIPEKNGQGPMASAGVNRDRKGNIWASVGKSVFRRKEDSFVKFELPAPKKRIESFSILAGDASFQLEDRKGNLWFGTDGDGIYRYDGKDFKHITKDDGLCSNNITSIIEDRKGQIWIACMQSFQPNMTGDGGLCRYDGKSFTQFPDVKGLKNNDIYTIKATNSGDIWIGATGVGAYRYDGISFSLFDTTDRPHWTRHFGVQSILEDRDGTLWFGFSGGLFRFNGKSFYNVKKKGPWLGQYSAMDNAISGKEIPTGILPSETHAALTALSNKQFDKAQQILLKLQRDSPSEPTIQEFALNEFGYRLVFTKRLKEATEIFKINTQLYPQAFNTFDSLAESHHRQGDERLAVENYARSVDLNPKNEAAKRIIVEIKARQRYENILVAPQGWMEEVITLPPRFAPSMELQGLEHLRLPPEFRKPESDWFCSYLFAMELSKPAAMTESFISNQLLIYFQGLGDGTRDENGERIDPASFTMKPALNSAELPPGEFAFVLDWHEPFVSGAKQQLNIRAKFLREKHQHGVLFVCGSPQPLTSNTWKELLRIRSEYESIPSSGNGDANKTKSD